MFDKPTILITIFKKVVDLKMTSCYTKKVLRKTEKTGKTQFIFFTLKKVKKNFKNVLTK